MKKVVFVSVIILCILLGCAVSFFITAGIVKLIFILLGLKFTWKIAAVVWLVMVLIAGVTGAGRR